MNIKEFSKAVKDKKLIIFGWDCDEGYYVVLTQKVPKQGFVHIEEKKIFRQEVNRWSLGKGL